MSITKCSKISNICLTLDDIIYHQKSWWILTLSSDLLINCNCVLSIHSHLILFCTMPFTLCPMQQHNILLCYITFHLCFTLTLYISSFTICQYVSALFHGVSFIHPYPSTQNYLVQTKEQELAHFVCDQSCYCLVIVVI